MTGFTAPSRRPETPPASRSMRGLVTLALVMPFVLVALAWLWGSRLPAERQAHHSTEVEASPGAVAALLGDASLQPTWWPRIERIEPLELADGVDRVRQVFVDGRSAHLRITDPGLDSGLDAADVTDEIVWTIADPAGPYRGTWRFRILANAGGSQIVLEEKARLGNPFARLLVVWRGGGGGMAEDCLAALTNWGRRRHG